jgi:transcriptional regulator with XRE-family HTH domain
MILTVKTLKEIREQNAFSIRGSAAKAGVSPSTIARIGGGLPARHISKRAICKVLKVKPQDVDWTLSYKLP